MRIAGKYDLLPAGQLSIPGVLRVPSTRPQFVVCDDGQGGAIDHNAAESCGIEDRSGLRVTLAECPYGRPHVGGAPCSACTDS